MALQITKNTIGRRITKAKADLKSKGILAVERGLEAVRSEIVPLTPVLTGRLKGSIGASTSDGISNIEQKNMLIVGRVGTKVPYARRIEFKRFFFSRGFNAAKGKVKSIIINTLKF